MTVIVQPRLKPWEKFIIGFLWAGVFALAGFTLLLSTIKLP